MFQKGEKVGVSNDLKKTCYSLQRTNARPTMSISTLNSRHKKYTETHLTKVATAMAAIIKRVSRKR